ncbi:thioesterase family protein [Ruegeria conchae]|uniref:thioesterase family protein n=1 Tax=Ruegeria conchae TaxID=981384 RepID=UPI0014801967|nr:thioesterase family protein [Ruegeria conchae]UWR02224.1 thioesterase family protein [Ruegeria conchae]
MISDVLGQAYFHQNTQGEFVGNDPARGPWSADHCHAGPVSGLIVRAAETEVGPDKMLTRLTVNLLRPLPLAGLRVAAETTRHTKTLATTRVTVHDLDDTLCATATTMHVVRRDLGSVPNVDLPAPRLEDVVDGPFPIGEMRHDLPGFAHHSEIGYPAGGNQGAGPKIVWMRTPTLVDGEDPSPIQALCPLADCGNGISWNAPTTEMGFMNTDLTIQVHREPTSDWLASDSISHWQPSGIGMSQSVLFDTQGPVGTALQTLVLFPPN